MDYVSENPLGRTTTPTQRFAGQVDIQSSMPRNKSKYLQQGQDSAEEQRKSLQTSLDAQIAAESGGSTIGLGDFGQIQIK